MQSGNVRTDTVSSLPQLTLRRAETAVANETSGALQSKSSGVTTRITERGKRARKPSPVIPSSIRGYRVLVIHSHAERDGVEVVQRAAERVSDRGWT